MYRTISTSGLASLLQPARRAVTGALTVGLICLAACGSDDKKANYPSDGNTTTGPTPTVVNSDMVSGDPTLSPTSPEVKATNGSTVSELSYVLVNNNPNATDPNKAFSIAANSYDACTFGFRHGYSKFPTGKFDFAGFYLINGTPGAPIAAGVYTAGATTGMYIAPSSGAGYNLVKCKASGYATVASGTITVDKVGTGTGGTTGSLNVTMSDGSVITGAFTTGACVGGSNTAPAQATDDPYACSKLN